MATVPGEWTPNPLSRQDLRTLSLTLHGSADRDRLHHKYGSGRQSRGANLDATDAITKPYQQGVGSPEVKHGGRGGSRGLPGPDPERLLNGPTSPGNTDLN